MKKLLISLIIVLLGTNLALLVTVYNLRFNPEVPVAPANLQVASEPVSVPSVTDVVQKSLPSAVTVGIDKMVDHSQSFDPFFPFLPALPLPNQGQEIKQNIASGFIISADGLIITNKHVVDDTAASYTVITNDNQTYQVINIYRDPNHDIAILKINPSAGSGQALKPVTLGDSSNLQLGQTVIAIGTPLGEFKNSVTMGIISGLGRGITAGSPWQGPVEQLTDVIQTDAPISPGNSGGPLLNTGGQVIGINTAIVEGGENIGFAIPVNVIRDSVNSFRANGPSFL